MRSSAEKVFTAYAVSHGTGYVLTWELSKNSIMELVIATMDWDEKEFREMGFRPLFFEIEAEGSLEGMNPPFSSPLKLRGCLDRVDQRTTPPELRIVDYKFQQGQKMKGQDRDLLTSGIRGFRLQPPLYALMTAFGNVGPPQKAPQQGFQVGSVELLFLAPRWEQTINCSTFNSSAWQTPSGRQLKKTFQTLLEGIHAGRYFILPGTYCDHCDVSVACRRFHGPTWWRAHRYAPTKQLRQLRTQRMNSD
jgi:ATP-dependent helicase/nuclease subunit B